MPVVTKESLNTMLQHENPNYIKHVIGRALVAIFKRQTENEKISNSTTVHNNIGFAGCDARSGSLTAKYFLKHNNLLDWQVDLWVKDWRGYPRICKYWKQLNEISESKSKC